MSIREYVSSALSCGTIGLDEHLHRPIASEAGGADNVSIIKHGNVSLALRAQLRRIHTPYVAGRLDMLAVPVSYFGTEEYLRAK